ncbi:MAG: YgiT-type zinc finger protein [Acidobacteriota bacterium]
MNPKEEEKLVERRVKYTLEFGGKFYIIENVPARVNEETGEQFFSPSTAERLQKTILGRLSPTKVMETPVYEYTE